jgi:hypothetical protein
MTGGNGCVAIQHVHALTTRGWLLAGFNRTTVSDAGDDLGLADCVDGMGMYSSLVEAGAIPGGYSTATLQDFCLGVMFEDLGAEA